MAVKADFITALRTTPEGIQGFLTTPIPTLTAISDPADVDAAILAQGILSANINKILQTFEGLTPIELILRVGQHSNVTEAMLFAGLEYIQDAAGANAQHDFTIVDPTDGQAYTPGNLRVQVAGKNGTLQQVAAEIAGHAPTALDMDAQGTFWGFLRVEELGAATVTCTALFTDGSTDSRSVTVTIAEVVADPQPGQTQPNDSAGGDLNAFQAAKKVFDNAVAKYLRFVANNWGAVEDTFNDAADWVDSRGLHSRGTEDEIIDAAKTAEAKYYLFQIGELAKQLIKNGESVAPSIWDKMGSMATAAVNKAMAAAETIPKRIIAELGDLKAEIDQYAAAVIADYWKRNQHPAGGYTSCPEALAGAAQAMNDKYGAGTVSY